MGSILLQSEFSDIRSVFMDGLDYTAWIYFQTTPNRLKKLIADLQFEAKEDVDYGYRLAGFSDAPDLPLIEQVVIYHRTCPEKSDIQYLITNQNHDRAWFVSLDY